jgi:hypothetical protein
MPIVFNLIVLVMVGFIAYMWSQEGLISGMIHLVCAVIAGAVALSVWEPLAYLMLGVREDIAWSVSLAVPFLVTLGVTRVLMDMAIPHNMKFSPVTNLIGGGAFGLGSGIIAVGILVISMGFLRLPSDFLGYKPITYDTHGNLRRSSGLWLPADRLTAQLYERLSVSGFATGTPLASYAPGINEQASLMRITFDDRARNTMSPEDFTAIGRYTVSAATPNDLFKDAENDNIQQARGLDDRPFIPGTTINGFVIRFEPGAKESSGQIVLGAGQIGLLYEDENGATRRALPIAMVTQAKSERVVYGRFRFDAAEVFLASVGAASNATMAFEFPLPPHARATFLMVKNIRVPVSKFGALPISGAVNGLLTVAQRDAAIGADQILVGSAAIAGVDGVAGGPGGPGKIEINRGGAVISGIDFNDLNASGVRVTTKLRLGYSKADTGAIEINADNKIIRGEKSFTELTNDVSPKLMVNEFYTEPGTTLVMIDVSWGTRLTIAGKAKDAALAVMPIQLRAPGQTPYEVVGYVYTNDRGTTIHYDRGAPILSYSLLPKVSQSKPQDKLTLLFLVDKRRDVHLETLQLGPEPIATFSPPLPVMN